MIRQLSLFAMADIIGLTIGIIVSPIVTRLLTPSQYGAVPVLSAVWSVFALFQYGGMDCAFPFFVSRSNSWSADTVRATSTRIVQFSAVFIWSIFGLWLFWSGYGESGANMMVCEVALYFLGVLPSVLIGWQLYIMRFELQATFFARLSIFGRVLAPLLAMPMMALATQEYRLSLSLLAGGGAAWIAWWWAEKMMKKAGFFAFHSVASFSLAKEMIRYGIVLVPGGAIYALFAVVDRLLIGYYCTTADMAVFMLATSVGGVALLFKSWFSRIFDPYLVRWVASGQLTISNVKLQTSLDFLAIIMTLLTLLAVFWSKHVFALLYPPAYERAAEFVPLIVLAGAISSLSLILIASPLIAGTAKFHLPVYSLGLLVNSFVGFLLITRLGVFGAVWGTLLGEGVIFLGWMVIGRWILRNLRLEMFFSMSLLTVALSVCTLYTTPVFFVNSPIFESTILSMISGGLAAGILFVRMRRNEWFSVIFAQIYRRGDLQ